MRIHRISDRETLKTVLKMCWDILGEPKTDMYSEEAWQSRLDKGFLLLYAEFDGEPIAATLARAENEGVVLGYCCYRKEFRRRGIAGSLLAELERSAAKNGYKYITLGSDDSAWGFYEKCGYGLINEIHGQRIYQKILLCGETG